MLKKNASPPTRYMSARLAKPPKSASLHTRPSSKNSRRRLGNWDCGTCSCLKHTLRRVLGSVTWSMGLWRSIWGSRGRPARYGELFPVRAYEEKILIDVGHELFGARHGKYGGYCQVWQRIPEEEVVRPTAGWQDSVCVLDDGAAGCIERCDQY